jgi:uncharacterized protein
VQNIHQDLTGVFMNRFSIFSWLLLAGLLSFTNLCIATDKQIGAAITLNAIPYPISIVGEHGKLVQQNQDLTITANKGTDLFYDMYSGVSKDNAPRLLFLPKGDFIFSAKLTGKFAGKYDGGALILYGNANSYGKLTFERGHDGQQSLWSTVTRKWADDVQHRGIKSDSLYLKVARAGNLCFFYSSADGKTWDMLRSFTLDDPQSLHVGIMAQAPEADTFSLTVSDIRFASRAFKDYWQGE